MSSLKGFIPRLAELLSTTPLALYGRQRALVKAGLLVAPEERRRGLGGGIQATHTSVSLLLIALLATDSVTETEERASAVANGELQGNHPPFSHRPNFKQALAAVVTQEGLCRRVEEVRVMRTAGRAIIRFKKSSRYIDAEFVFDREAPGILIEASIKADVLRQINADVAAIIESRVRPEDI